MHEQKHVREKAACSVIELHPSIRSRNGLGVEKLPRNPHGIIRRTAIHNDNRIAASANFVKARQEISERLAFIQHRHNNADRQISLGLLTSPKLICVPTKQRLSRYSLTQDRIPRSTPVLYIRCGMKRPSGLLRNRPTNWTVLCPGS